jgi:F420-dependent oxidoreductase-like protein
MDLTEIADPVEQYEAMTRVAREADVQPNVDSIWVYDHFHTTPKPTLQTTFECWTTTSAVARDTTRVKIGQMVTCNGYRHPALLAKMASTVDVLSHGRLYFGLGAGWYEHEWNAYGMRFPEVPVRMGMFREACELIVKMWTEDYPTFSGKYYAIDAPINEPKGVQKPHPSFWIGGGGEKVTLKLVAKWGNACNVGGTADQIRHKLAVLREHCDALGRDYESIIRSIQVDVHPVESERDAERATAAERGAESLEAYAKRVMVGTPERVAERIQEKVDAGANYVIAYLRRVAYQPDLVRVFASEVAPALT